VPLEVVDVPLGVDLGVEKHAAPSSPPVPPAAPLYRGVSQRFGQWTSKNSQSVGMAIMGFASLLYSLQALVVKILGDRSGFWTISVFRGVAGEGSKRGGHGKEAGRAAAPLASHLNPSSIGGKRTKSGILDAPPVLQDTP
jgi:hypothetical protein